MRADPVNRIIGKLIDVLLFLFFTQIFTPYGTAAGLIYLAVCDGFPGGRSLGKFLTRTRVVDASTGEPCSFRASVLRNIPVVVVFLFYIIPFVGWVLFLTVGVLIFMAEVFFVFRDEKGQRIGDTMANTVVVGVSHE